MSWMRGVWLRLAIALGFFLLSLVLSFFGDVRHQLLSSGADTVLESFYRFLIGNQLSFWSGLLYAPYENSTAFDESLLGSAPFYAFFRGLGWDSQLALHGWWVLGTGATLGATFWFFRQMRFDRRLSFVGAVFYWLGAVNLSETMAVVVYLFPVPVAIWTGWRFFRSRSPWWFLASWTGAGVQALFSLQVGFFLLLTLIPFWMMIPRAHRFFSFPQRTWTHWLAPAGVGLLGAICFLGLLFPYIEVAWAWDFSVKTYNFSTWLPPFVGVGIFVGLGTLCYSPSAIYQKEILRLHGWGLGGAFLLSLSLWGRSLFELVEWILPFTYLETPRNVWAVGALSFSCIFLVGLSQFRRWAYMAGGLSLGILMFLFLSFVAERELFPAKGWISENSESSILAYWHTGKNFWVFPSAARRSVFTGQKTVHGFRALPWESSLNLQNCQELKWLARERFQSFCDSSEKWSFEVVGLKNCLISWDLLCEDSSLRTWSARAAQSAPGKALIQHLPQGLPLKVPDRPVGVYRLSFWQQTAGHIQLWTAHNLWGSYVQIEIVLVGPLVWVLGEIGIDVHVWFKDDVVVGWLTERWGTQEGEIVSTLRGSQSLVMHRESWHEDRAVGSLKTFEFSTSQEDFVGFLARVFLGEFPIGSFELVDRTKKFVGNIEPTEDPVLWRWQMAFEGQIWSLKLKKSFASGPLENLSIPFRLGTLEITKRSSSWLQ